MTENKIILPPSLLTALYTDVLIDPGHGPADNAPAKKVQPKNTVVVCFSAADFISPEEDLFLTSVLSACKLNRDAVELMTDKNPLAAHYMTIQDTYNPDVVLLFGLKPASIQLPVHFPEFQVQTLNNTKYICAPSLESIQADKSCKVQLWKSLQQIYPI